MGPKFSCYTCDKVLHLSPECTMFTNDEVKVLIKLNDNLLHICNDCKPKRDDLVKNKTTTSNKLDEQFDNLQLQMKVLTEKMEQSSTVITQVQADMKTLKEKPNNFRAAVGNVSPGRVLNSPTVPKTQLGIGIRGVPESKDKSDIERMQEDLGTIDRILAFLQIDDRKLSKATRIGKFNPDKGPCTLLFNTESSISKNLILKSTSKLKDFSELRVFISPELSKADAKKENNCLKKRRELIVKNHDPSKIKIRNLKLELKENEKWIVYEESKTSPETDNNADQAGDVAITG